MRERTYGAQESEIREEVYNEARALRPRTAENHSETTPGNFVDYCDSCRPSWDQPSVYWGRGRVADVTDHGVYLGNGAVIEVADLVVTVTVAAVLVVIVVAVADETGSATLIVNEVIDNIHFDVVEFHFAVHLTETAVEAVVDVANEEAIAETVVDSIDKEVAVVAVAVDL